MKKYPKTLLLLLFISNFALCQNNFRKNEIILSIIDTHNYQIISDAQIYFINPDGHEIDITNIQKYNYVIDDTFGDSSSIFLKITAKNYITGYYILSPKDTIRGGHQHYYQLHLTNYSDYSNYEGSELREIVFKNKKYSVLPDDNKYYILELAIILEKNKSTGFIISPFYVSDQPSDSLCEFALNNTQLVYNYLIIHISEAGRLKIEKPVHEKPEFKPMYAGMTFLKFKAFIIK